MAASSPVRAGPVRCSKAFVGKERREMGFSAGFGWGNDRSDFRLPAAFLSPARAHRPVLETSEAVPYFSTSRACRASSDEFAVAVPPRSGVLLRAKKSPAREPSPYDHDFGPGLIGTPADGSPSCPVRASPRPTRRPSESPVESVRRTLSQTRPTPRRGLSRVEAAMFVGVSPSLFDQLVADGRMPEPFRINGRKIWDLHKVDIAFDALSSCDGRDESWDDFDQPTVNRR
jgi:predicted DNA-binding transcriptional regulator AlpA